jgi:hypothetical protein
MEEVKVHAMALVSNRYGSDVVVEISDVPVAWRAPGKLIIECRDPVTGKQHVGCVFPEEDLEELWYSLTGLRLQDERSWT